MTEDQAERIRNERTDPDVCPVCNGPIGDRGIRLVRYDEHRVCSWECADALAAVLARTGQRGGEMN
jgi:hypothetical protein